MGIEVRKNLTAREGTQHTDPQLHTSLLPESFYPESLANLREGRDDVCKVGWGEYLHC